MKKVKKISGLLLAFCMIASILSMTNFVWAGTYIEPEIEAEYDNKIIIEPRDNYTIIDESITQRGVSWSQPSGYHAYRVWVENTTNQKMTVTINSNGGTFVKYVGANDSKVVLVVNNAWENEKHTIDFTTSSGAVSGRVTVRVSDTDLSY